MTSTANPKLSMNEFKFVVSSPPPFSSIGLFTFLRTYARRHDENDPNSTIESWEDALTRVLNACNSQLNVGFSHEEAQEAFDLMYNLKCSVAGRFLWQLGTETVAELGLPSLQNCAVKVIDEPIEPFTWIMNFLMCGSGTGFRITPEDVENFPIIKKVKIVRMDTKDADYIVPDSREGWIKLLGKVLKAHFYSGENFSYSCLLLRSKGAPIKKFGGLASGPDILCDGMAKINDLLNKRVGQKIRPIDCLDICNLIGMIVVSGNVRRSAEMAVGSCKDKEFLHAKDWSKGNIPNHRAYSNNTVICNNIEDILDDEDFWAGYQGNGEPYGLINLDLCRKCGRLGEIQYSDPEMVCTNPCGEMTLAKGETCCLAELFLPNIVSKDELFKCAMYLYRICKHSLRLPCKISKQTETIVHKNMRMGIGVSGYLQATEEQKNWLSDCYEYLRKFDVEYSRKNNFPVSIKIATVKPSGSLSLLGNCTPGVHPGFAQFYKRRIRVASESPLLKIAREHGYHIEYSRRFDGTDDHTTQIVTFPMSFPKGTVLAKECSAIRQLEYVKRLQTEWSDNAVSVTVYYRKEELPEIKDWLRKNYNNSVKTVSFLLHSEHGFLQAPLEEITKEEYEKMTTHVKPIIDLKGICYVEDELEQECVGGQCPIR